MPTLLVITGPIGAGKSTVSALLGRRLSAARKDAAIVDLDDIEFMQHTRTLDVGAWWARGVEAHAALVAQWFALGVDIVVAHGPLVAIDVPGYDIGPLLRAVPEGVRVWRALLHAPFDAAVGRVRNDPDRADTALSRDETWLRGAHERFAAALARAPAFRWEFDAVANTAREIAGGIAADLLTGGDNIAEGPP